MKRGILIFILLIVFSFSVSAQVPLNDYNEYNYLNMKFLLDGSFKVLEKTMDSRVIDIITNLTFFPRNEAGQQVIYLDAKSDPVSVVTKSQENVLYVWKNPSERKYKFWVESDVKTRNAIVTIDEKIEFPLKYTDESYTKATEFIDINDDISAKAQELAEGEDDLYFLSVKVADWVQKNIKYDLSTLTADAVQKSSWVFENKEGVCDELTNLFISMMRSLGVPARYVSGMAYTNTINQWGPHAWAEVYFPDKGWVPFDITYVQYGWIDPSHIKVKVGVDSGDPAVKYSWKSIDTDFVPSKINVTTILLEKGKKVSAPLTISIKPLIDNVGEGSYVPIEVEVSNNNNYYFPVTLTISKAPELLDKNYAALVLRPGETKKIVWIAKIPENVEEDYLYRSKIEVEDNFHSTASSEITYAKDLKIIGLLQAEIFAKNSKNGEFVKQVSQKMAISCSSPDFIYTYESLEIKCDVKNTGNYQLNDVDVCLFESCKKINNIGIANYQSVKFSVKNLSYGSNNIGINAKADDVEASDIVKVEAVESSVDVSDFIYEKEIYYGVKTRMEINLDVKIPVKNVEVFINGAKISELEEINKSKKIVVISSTSEFVNNKIKLEIKFKDKNNKYNFIEKEYPIKILNVPWYIKLFNILRLN